MVFKRLVLILALICSISAVGLAANRNITGTVSLPNTSLVLQNGTFTFDLNQAAIIAGSFSIAPSTLTCYTSTSGAVVGLPNPLVTSISTAVTGAGTLSGTYYVKIAYYTGATVTLVSPVSTVLVSGPNNAITVTAPVIQPTGSSGYKVYAGATLGSETLQATTAGWGSTTINSISAGTALPSSNTTVCSMEFNDAFIPTGTVYRVNLVDANGTQIPGFPQDWWLGGSAVDITSQYPIASVANRTRFPTPIISNPFSNSQQSLNSPLTLNGYAITVGSLLLPDNANPTACAAGKTVIYTDSTTHAAMICENGGAAAGLLGAATGGWTDAGSNIYNTTTTDRVMIGTGSSAGDFSNASFNGNLIVKGYIYAASGVTDATVGALAYDSGTTTVRLASGITGSGTARDLAVTTYNGGNVERSRWDTSGRFLHGLASTDSSNTNGVYSIGGFYVTTATSAASVGGFYYDGLNTVMAISSGITVGGTGRPLSFFLYNSTSATNDEVGRWESVTDLAGTGKVHNFEIGQSITSAYDEPLRVRRSQNYATSITVNNPAAGTLASASFRALGEAGVTDPDANFGVTSGSFTTANGIPASTAFVIAQAGATGGLYLQANAGVVKILEGSTSLATFDTGTSPVFATALANTSGGTGNNAAFASSGIPYASSTTVLSTSANHVWNNTDATETVTGSILVKSATRVNPTGGTSYLHLFYDAGTTTGLIGAVDYTGPTYKALKLFGLTITFDANNNEVFKIGATGPQWMAGYATNASAGGTTLSLANTTFPGSVGGIPYTWLTALAADGTVVYIPAYK